MDSFTFIQLVCIWAIPVIFAITVHETAHGWVASKLGDPTAKMLGRLTLNPIRHIDPVGTVILPAILLFLGGFIFGWAKPVPVDYRNLKSVRRDTALVAVAGPLSNLLMALFWGLVGKLGYSAMSAGFESGQFFILMGHAGIMINVTLGLLNLIPIPPLDGSRVVASLLPQKIAYLYNRLEPFGFIILLLMLAMGWLAQLLLPSINFVSRWIIQFFNWPFA